MQQHVVSVKYEPNNDCHENVARTPFYTTIYLGECWSASFINLASLIGMQASFVIIAYSISVTKPR